MTPGFPEGAIIKGLLQLVLSRGQSTAAGAREERRGVRRGGGGVEVEALSRPPPVRCAMVMPGGDGSRSTRQRRRESNKPLASPSSCEAIGATPRPRLRS
ncbi:hypothetical protein E2562_022851 [Oryza meyeriana var. granulata]|uniref:Uncharacterized protein n=1 Tax=Oryza meyeriana var. granulata TaxID=110450 RepID=A0A6G1BNB5_9ORYZ|nr:hypothetical protein E2562_022851 [Oryza meyeriana var. granulata]